MPSIRFGNVYEREYALGTTTGVMESDDSTAWPLGLSNAVLVRDEGGRVTGAIDIVSGGATDVTVPGDEVSAPRGRGRRARGLSVSSASGDGTTPFLLLSSSLSAGAGADSATGASASSTAADSSRVTGLDLKPGERLVASIDELCDAREAMVAERVNTGAAALADGFQPLNAAQRSARFLRAPSLGGLTPSDLEAAAADLKTIVASRAESRVGCNCGVLTAEHIQDTTVPHLRELARARGLDETGTKKILVARLVAATANSVGCSFSCADEDADPDVIEEIEAASQGRDIRLFRAHGRARELVSTLGKTAGAGEGASGGTGAGIRSAATAGVLPGCACAESGLGCHYRSCSCFAECKNRPSGDPSSSVYDEQTIEFQRKLLLAMVIAGQKDGELFFSEDSVLKWRARYARYILQQLQSTTDDEDEISLSPEELAELLLQFDEDGSESDSSSAAVPLGAAGAEASADASAIDDDFDSAVRDHLFAALHASEPDADDDDGSTQESSAKRFKAGAS